MNEMTFDQGDLAVIVVVSWATKGRMDTRYEVRFQQHFDVGRDDVYLFRSHAEAIEWAALENEIAGLSRTPNLGWEERLELDRLERQASNVLFHGGTFAKFNWNKM